MYDLKAIKNDLSCLDVAESLGIKMQKKGQYHSILCPAHNDKHLGSCFIFGNKWKCFACGAGGDVFSLIHEATGLTNAELFKEAARLTGSPEKYEIDSKEEDKIKTRIINFPLTNEELDLLDLKKSFTIPFTRYLGYSGERSDLKEIPYINPDNTDETLYGTYESFSLLDIYESDPEFFKTIVTNLATEKIRLYDFYINENIALLFPMFDSEMIYLLKNEFKIRKIKTEEIIKKVA